MEKVDHWDRNLRAMDLLAGTAARLLMKLLAGLGMILSIAGLFFPGVLPFVDLIARFLPDGGSLFD